MGIFEGLDEVAGDIPVILPLHPRTKKCLIISKFKIQNSKFKHRYIPTHSEVEKYLRETIDRDDVIILMGAGDQYKIGETILN